MIGGGAEKSGIGYMMPVARGVARGVATCTPGSTTMPAAIATAWEGEEGV